LLGLPNWLSGCAPAHMTGQFIVHGGPNDGLGGDAPADSQSALHIGEHFAITVSTVLTEPGHHTILRQLVAGQKRPRKAMRVIAPF